MIDKVEGSEPGASGEKLLNYTSMALIVIVGIICSYRKGRKTTQLHFYGEKSSVGTTDINNGF